MWNVNQINLFLQQQQKNSPPKKIATKTLP